MSSKIEKEVESAMKENNSELKNQDLHKNKPIENNKDTENTNSEMENKTLNQSNDVNQSDQQSKDRVDPQSSGDDSSGKSEDSIQANGGDSKINQPSSDYQNSKSDNINYQKEVETSSITINSHKLPSLSPNLLMTNLFNRAENAGCTTRYQIAAGVSSITLNYFKSALDKDSVKSTKDVTPNSIYINTEILKLTLDGQQVKHRYSLDAIDISNTFKFDYYDDLIFKPTSIIQDGFNTNCVSESFMVKSTSTTIMSNDMTTHINGINDTIYAPHIIPEGIWYANRFAIVDTRVAFPQRTLFEEIVTDDKYSVTNAHIGYDNLVFKYNSEPQRDLLNSVKGLEDLISKDVDLKMLRDSNFKIYEAAIDMAVDKSRGYCYVPFFSNLEKCMYATLHYHKITNAWPKFQVGALYRSAKIMKYLISKDISFGQSPKDITKVLSKDKFHFYNTLDAEDHRRIDFSTLFTNMRDFYSNTYKSEEDKDLLVELPYDNINIAAALVLATTDLIYGVNWVMQATTTDPKPISASEQGFPLPIDARKLQGVAAIKTTYVSEFLHNYQLLPNVKFVINAPNIDKLPWTYQDLIDKLDGSWEVQPDYFKGAIEWYLSRYPLEDQLVIGHDYLMRDLGSVGKFFHKYPKSIHTYENNVFMFLLLPRKNGKYVITNTIDTMLVNSCKVKIIYEILFSIYQDYIVSASHQVWRYIDKCQQTLENPKIVVPPWMLSSFNEYIKLGLSPCNAFNPAYLNTSMLSKTSQAVFDDWMLLSYLYTVYKMANHTGGVLANSNKVSLVLRTMDDAGLTGNPSLDMKLVKGIFNPKDGKPNQYSHLLAKFTGDNPKTLLCGLGGSTINIWNLELYDDLKSFFNTKTTFQNGKLRILDCDLNLLEVAVMMNNTVYGCYNINYCTLLSGGVLFIEGEQLRNVAELVTYPNRNIKILVDSLRHTNSLDIWLKYEILDFINNITNQRNFRYDPLQSISANRHKILYIDGVTYLAGIIHSIIMSNKACSEKLYYHGGFNLLYSTSMRTYSGRHNWINVVATSINDIRPGFGTDGVNTNVDIVDSVPVFLYSYLNQITQHRGENNIVQKYDQFNVYNELCTLMTTLDPSQTYYEEIIRQLRSRILKSQLDINDIDYIDDTIEAEDITHVKFEEVDSSKYSKVLNAKPITPNVIENNKIQSAAGESLESKEIKNNDIDESVKSGDNKEKRSNKKLVSCVLNSNKASKGAKTVGEKGSEPESGSTENLFSDDNVINGESTASGKDDDKQGAVPSLGDSKPNISIESEGQVHPTNLSTTQQPKKFGFKASRNKKKQGASSRKEGKGKESSTSNTQKLPKDKNKNNTEVTEYNVFKSNQDHVLYNPRLQDRWQNGPRSTIMGDFIPQSDGGLAPDENFNNPQEKTQINSSNTPTFTPLEFANQYLMGMTPFWNSYNNRNMDAHTTRVSSEEDNLAYYGISGFEGEGLSLNPNVSPANSNINESVNVSGLADGEASVNAVHVNVGSRSEVPPEPSTTQEVGDPPHNNTPESHIENKEHEPNVASGKDIHIQSSINEQSPLQKLFEKASNGTLDLYVDRDALFKNACSQVDSMTTFYHFNEVQNYEELMGYKFEFQGSFDLKDEQTNMPFVTISSIRIESQDEIYDSIDLSAHNKLYSNSSCVGEWFNKHYTVFDKSKNITRSQTLHASYIAFSNELGEGVENGTLDILNTNLQSSDTYFASTSCYLNSIEFVRQCILGFSGKESEERYLSSLGKELYSGIGYNCSIHQDLGSLYPIDIIKRSIQISFKNVFIAQWYSLSMFISDIRFILRYIGIKYGLLKSSHSQHNNLNNSHILAIEHYIDNQSCPIEYEDIYTNWNTPIFVFTKTHMYSTTLGYFLESLKLVIYKGVTLSSKNDITPEVLNALIVGECSVKRESIVYPIPEYAQVKLYSPLTGIENPKHNIKYIVGDAFSSTKYLPYPECYSNLIKYSNFPEFELLVGEINVPLNDNEYYVYKGKVLKGSEILQTMSNDIPQQSSSECEICASTNRLDSKNAILIHVYVEGLYDTYYILRDKYLLNLISVGDIQTILSNLIITPLVKIFYELLHTRHTIDSLGRGTWQQSQFIESSLYLDILVEKVFMQVVNYCSTFGWVQLLKFNVPRVTMLLLTDVLGSVVVQDGIIRILGNHNIISTHKLPHDWYDETQSLEAIRRLNSIIPITSAMPKDYNKGLFLSYGIYNYCWDLHTKYNVLFTSLTPDALLSLDKCNFENHVELFQSVNTNQTLPAYWNNSLVFLMDQLLAHVLKQVSIKLVRKEEAISVVPNLAGTMTIPTLLCSKTSLSNTGLGDLPTLYDKAWINESISKLNSGKNATSMVPFGKEFFGIDVNTWDDMIYPDYKGLGIGSSLKSIIADTGDCKQTDILEIARNLKTKKGKDRNVVDLETLVEAIRSKNCLTSDLVAKSDSLIISKVISEGIGKDYQSTLRTPCSRLTFGLTGCDIINQYLGLIFEHSKTHSSLSYKEVYEYWFGRGRESCIKVDSISVPGSGSLENVDLKVIPGLVGGKKVDSYKSEGISLIEIVIGMCLARQTCILANMESMAKHLQSSGSLDESDMRLFYQFKDTKDISILESIMSTGNSSNITEPVDNSSISSIETDTTKAHNRETVSKTATPKGDSTTGAAECTSSSGFGDCIEKGTDKALVSLGKTEVIDKIIELCKDSKYNEWTSQISSVSKKEEAQVERRFFTSDDIETGKEVRSFKVKKSELCKNVNNMVSSMSKSLERRNIKYYDLDLSRIPLCSLYNVPLSVYCKERVYSKKNGVTWLIYNKSSILSQGKDNSNIIKNGDNNSTIIARALVYSDCCLDNLSVSAIDKYAKLIDILSDKKKCSEYVHWVSTQSIQLSESDFSKLCSFFYIWNNSNENGSITCDPVFCGLLENTRLDDFEIYLEFDPKSGMSRGALESALKKDSKSKIVAPHKRSSSSLNDSLDITKISSKSFDYIINYLMFGEIVEYPITSDSVHTYGFKISIMIISILIMLLLV